MQEKLITKSFERLLDKGKHRGFITYEELGKSLGKRNSTTENIERAFIIIVDEKITLVEKKSQFQSNKKKETTTQSEEKTSDKSDDPIRMYLREMGGVELLSREGEIAIAKRIEAGKDVMLNALSQSPITAQQFYEWNEKSPLKINNFGKEKTKYITDAKLKIMFVDPRNVVIQHIKDTYYHVLHPENFNAKITNCKSKHMHIYKESGWEKVNKQLTICSMYNKHEKIIESEFERLKPELTDKVRDNYNEYKESTLHCFSTFKQRMVDTEAVIINGTKRHKEIDLLSKKEVARLAKEQGKTPGEIFAEHMPDIFAERDGLIDDT